MMKYSNNAKLLEKYDGRTTRSPKRLPLSDFGVDGTWYGGHCVIAAEVPDTIFTMLLGEENKTIAIVIRDEDIPKLTAEERVMFRIKEEKPTLELDETKQVPIEDIKTAPVQAAKVSPTPNKLPPRAVHRRK